MAHRPWPDRALGVFETILIVDGSPIELDAHLERLDSSAQELFDARRPADAREAVLEHARPLVLGRLRLTIFPGEGRALEFKTATATVDREDVFPSWERATAVCAFVMRGGLGAHKWSDRAPLDRMQAREPGCLPLLLDAGDEVLEASRANVFAVAGETLITPPADGRILPGVARARVIATARSRGVEVREQALALGDLIAAGEAFLTGSIRGVEPVCRVGDSELAPSGAVAAGIAADLCRAWIGERDLRWSRAI